MIYETETFDRQSVSSTGWTVQIRSKSHAHLIYRSRWQGSYDGAHYIAPLPEEVIAALDNIDGRDTDRPNLDTTIHTWLDDALFYNYRDEWRMIRRGTLVQ